MASSGRREHRGFKTSNILRSILNCMEEFCSQTSIQGFNHIVAPGRHMAERVLWTAVIGLGVYGAVAIFRDQWIRYQENPTVVTLDKDFRSWRYYVPGVTVCAENKTDPSKVAKEIKRVWNVERNDSRYWYYARFIEAVANSNLTSLEAFQDYERAEDLEVDLFELAKQVLPNFHIKVTWSGLSQNWTRTSTELGLCYSTNNLALTDISIDEVKNATSRKLLTCRYSSQCSIALEMTSQIKVYIHSPFDVPDLNDVPSPMEQKVRRLVDIAVTETTSGPGVRELGVRRRRCKYNDEPSKPVYRVYSAALCRRACRNRLAINLCGCKPFYNFYDEGEPCSTKGMACLSRYTTQLRSQATCSCMPQCEHADYKEIAVAESSLKYSTFTKTGTLIYSIQAPRTRYTREIMFHFHDLVVSFGGAVGLFIGASFLSFVEIIYFIIEKLLRILSEEERKKREEAVARHEVSLSWTSCENGRGRHLTANSRNDFQNYPLPHYDEATGASAN